MEEWRERMNLELKLFAKRCLLNHVNRELQKINKKLDEKLEKMKNEI